MTENNSLFSGDRSNFSAADEAQSSELLPCPFCGGAARRKIIKDILQVGCGDCLIMFSNHVRLGCFSDIKWNTRVNNQKG